MLANPELSSLRNFVQPLDERALAETRRAVNVATRNAFESKVPEAARLMGQVEAMQSISMPSNQMFTNPNGSIPFVPFFFFYPA